MSQEFYVYQLRLEGEEKPFYIGKGKGDRATHHTKARNLAWDKSFKANIIRKAQANNVEVIVEYLEVGLTSQEALDFEEIAIWLYGRRANGTGCLANLTDGKEGTSGYKWSEAQKDGLKKIAKANANTKQFRSAISNALTGRKRVDALKPRKKRARAVGNHPNDQLSPENRAKQIAAILGKPLSIETKKKLAEACAGEKAYQSKLTSDQVRAIRHEHSLGERSITSFSEEYGLSVASMSKVIRRQTYKDVE